MKNLIFIILSILIILYIIDRKKIVPLKIKNDMNSNINEINYIDIFTENILTKIKEINPLKTNQVWTYIEIYDISKNHQNFYKKYTLIPYFIECVKKLNNSVLDLIIITPLNIRHYLPDFDLIMSPTSPIPLKKRVDILFSELIEKYGGLCISPGTIVYNIQPLLNKVGNTDLVTIGNSSNILNNYNNKLYPNTYVIGGKKNSPIIKQYRIKLRQSIDQLQSFNVRFLTSQEILSNILHYSDMDDNHLHFNIDHDGSHDINMKTLTIDDYLGTEKIVFKQSNELYLITFPYEELTTNLKYRWFRELSYYDFKHSNVEINRLLELDT
tara:strand:+ start:1082 stop:2059 length:978 start_codon:yes stop_codon:yes gene_type:complete